MAIRVISETGGNWNNPNSWVDGLIPEQNDDFVGTNISGPLTVNVNCICKNVDLGDYNNYIIFNDEFTLSITGTINLSFVSPMFLVNPLFCINLLNPATIVFVDFEQRFISFSNGSEIYLIKFLTTEEFVAWQS